MSPHGAAADLREDRDLRTGVRYRGMAVQQDAFTVGG